MKAVRFPQSGFSERRWLAAERQDGVLHPAVRTVMVLLGGTSMISDQQDDLEQAPGPGRTAQEGIPRQAGQGSQSGSAEAAARRYARHPAPVAAAAAEQDRNAGVCSSTSRRPRCRRDWKPSCSSPARNRSRKASTPRSRSRCACSAPITNSARSSAASRRCRVSSS